jgi:hypothetical protein
MTRENRQPRLAPFSPSRCIIRITPGLVELDELLHTLLVVAAQHSAGLAEFLFGGQEVRLGLGVAALTCQAGAVPTFRPGGPKPNIRVTNRKVEPQDFAEGIKAKRMTPN